MKEKIAIIGGGYTGLSAAYELAKNNYDVTIYEASSQVGGLASGFKVEGYPLEKAYHHIFKTDTAIINLANEIGVGKNLKWYDSNTSLYYNGTLYPFKGALDLLRFKPLKFHNRLRAGVCALWLQLTNHWNKYENITAEKWVRKYMGEEVFKVIWEPLLLGKFHKYADKVSMAWLWARIHTRSNSKEKGGEKLGWFDEGFQSFTNALITACEELDVKIITSAKIVTVNQEEKQVKIGLENDSVMYDEVVFTTPSYITAKLLPTANSKLIEKMNSIDYLGARLLIFSSEQQLSTYYWHNINDVSLPFLVFINHTNLVGKERYNNKNVYYLATYVPMDDKYFSMSNEELRKDWFDNLAKIFPHFDIKKVNEEHYFKFANAQHIVKPDYQKVSLVPYQIDNHIYLSNFTQVYPEDRGTNFAIKGGQIIANLIAEQHK